MRAVGLPVVSEISKGLQMGCPYQIFDPGLNRPIRGILAFTDSPPKSSYPRPTRGDITFKYEIWVGPGACFLIAIRR